MFLQGLWDEKVQQEFQWPESYGSYLQNLYLPLIGTTGRTGNTLPLGKPVAPLLERKRDNIAEKANL